MESVHYGGGGSSMDNTKSWQELFDDKEIMFIDPEDMK